MSKIMIVDDQKQITSILKEYALKAGYEVIVANDGEEALAYFHSTTFDLLLLDVMMPKMDGFQVCQEIRKESNVPIIMITAKGEDYNRIMGLDIGADDYIVKPFSPNEVFARIRAVLRRIEGHPPALAYDDLMIDITHYVVRIKDQIIPCTKKEVELLYLLATHPAMNFTREHLLDRLWGDDYEGDIRTVDSHIKRLRTKLDKCSHDGWNIKTVWGLGYQFEVHHED